MRYRVFYIFLFAIGLSSAANAQLDSYKYIIVPKKFEAFKWVNQYQTSTLTKYYFSENGFNVVYDDNLPADLAANRCLGLMANLLDESNMFTTRLVISLKDCNNVEVFSSKRGVSKTKDYSKSYKEALEDAFVSFEGMAYSYQPEEKETADTEKSVTVSFKDDVKSVEEASKKEHVVEQKSTTEEQVYKSVEPKPTNIVKATGNEVPTNTSVASSDLLYAQPIDNGFQLVDSSPKVVLKLEETSMENVFLTEFGGNNAVVFKKDGQWLLEYSENGEKVQKELNIKF